MARLSRTDTLRQTNWEKETNDSISCIITLKPVSEDTPNATEKSLLPDAACCVCKPDVSTTALQKTLDYACGGAGADCKCYITPAQCCHIGLTVPIASTRGMARLKQLVTSPRQPCLPPQIRVAKLAPSIQITRMLKQDDPLIFLFVLADANDSVYPATPSSTKVNTTIWNFAILSPPLVRRRLFSRIMGGINPSGSTSSVDGSSGGLLLMAVVVCLLSLLLEI